MVDITAKSVTAREAIASSSIRMSARAAQAVRAGGGTAVEASVSDVAAGDAVAGGNRKGDVLAVARVAAIGAAKWTSTLIPLCHAIPIEGVEIDFQWVAMEPADESFETLKCLATVRTTFKTGVEMEALTAASVAALTVYDMLKSVDRAMVIVETRLESKKGGKSGVFSRSSATPQLPGHEKKRY